MSQTNYTVEAKTTSEIFSTGSVAYEVPLFQRAYSWGKDEVDSLLDDLFGDGPMRGTTPDDETQYFLGSIVVANTEGHGRLQVLDGQQRLTTLSLILAVIAARLSQLRDPNVADIQRHLQAGKAGLKKEPILQMQEQDHELYRTLLNDALSEIPKHLAKTRLALAVKRIRDYLEAHLDANSDDLREQLWSYARKVLYGVTLVRISAPSESTAFALFETLNDRGLELSAADLIKNKILSRADRDYFNETVNDWEEILQLVDQPELVNFLRYFWIAHHGFVRKSQLYDRYAAHLNPISGGAVRAMVAQLKHYASIYAQISHPDKDSTSWPSNWPASIAAALTRLNDFRAKTCRPLFLATAGDNEALAFALKVAESLTLRHSIMANGNANILERAYAEACKSIQSKVPAIKAITDATSKYMPDNTTFHSNVVRARMGRADSAWRRILLELESQLSTGETEVMGADTVQIEHIMPKTLPPARLEELGLTAEEHEDLLGALGNLTLLHKSKNARASNRTLADKLEEYRKSEINLTREISNAVETGAPLRWGKFEIEQRTMDLATRLVTIWADPFDSDTHS